jgi:Rieske 2Fe-2S family protein
MSGPAPLPRADLLALLDQNRPGSMLPAAAYCDPAVLDWENEVLFAGGWLCVGRSDGLADPGAQRALSVADDTVLLIHGNDGVLRGFYNTCRHRGHELLPCGQTATRRFVSCPYHNWVYDLEGRLHGVPPSQRDDLDKSRYGLVAVPVVEWQGFVLVNASGDAPPVGQYLAGIDTHLAPYECERLSVLASHEYEVAANWKLLVENYHECYHCSSIHPELCRVSSPSSGWEVDSDGLWCGGTLELKPQAATMSFDGHSDGVVMRGVDEHVARQVLYLQVFPNLLLSLHPDYLMTHRVEPLGPDRSRVECQWLFPPEALARPGFGPAYAVDFWDLTNRQDWTACESVQRGLSSRGFRPGPLAEVFEKTMRDSITMLARAYLDGRLPRSLTDAQANGVQRDNAAVPVGGRS